MKYLFDPPKESDWKRFRSMVTDLRERYLKERNHELVRLLTDPSKTPTEQFWETHDRMREIGKILVKCLDGHSRSKMARYLAEMRYYGMLKESDLEGFSDELREFLLACGPEEEGREGSPES